MKLYHGTSPENLTSIAKSGTLRGPVFLSPRKEIAEEYSGENGVVVEVEVDEPELLIDLDLPGSRLLSVEDSNFYLRHEGWTIRDYLDEGYSVGTVGDVLVRAILKNDEHDVVLDTSNEALKQRLLR